jgi:hypothetical protein
MSKKKTTDECIDDFLDLAADEEETQPTTEKSVVKKKGDVENSNISTSPKDQRTSRTVEREKLDNDFEYARTNYYGAITTGQTILEDFAEVASASQQPRAVEVLAGLIRALNESTAGLMTLHKDKQLVEKRELEGMTPTETNVTNNNLILSTDDLLKLIEPKKPESVEAMLAEDGETEVIDVTVDDE